MAKKKLTSEQENWPFLTHLPSFLHSFILSPMVEISKTIDKEVHVLIDSLGRSLATALSIVATFMYLVHLNATSSTGRITTC